MEEGGRRGRAWIGGNGGRATWGTRGDVGMVRDGVEEWGMGVGTNGDGYFRQIWLSGRGMEY